MACKYLYQGEEYNKEELIGVLSETLFKDLGTNNVFKSIAIKKDEPSDIRQDTIKVLYNRYKQAQDMIQSVKNNDTLSKFDKLKKIAEYKKIMSDTNASRKELIEVAPENALDWVLTQAESDVKLIDTIYNSSKVSFNELAFAANTVDTWININKSLGLNTIFSIKDDPNNPERKKTRERLANILNIYKAFDERTRALAIELITQLHYGPKVSEKDINELTDTTVQTLYTRELTTTGIPLPSKIAYVIKDINFKINKEHSVNYNMLDSQFATIKDNPLFKKEGWDLFVKTQKDKAGNEILGIVTRYTQVFWENVKINNRLRRERIERANGDKSKIKEAWKVFNAWNEKNTIPFDSRSWLEFDNYTDIQRQAEVDRMKTFGFNDMEINDMIGESQRLYTKFLENKEQYNFELELNISNHPEIIPTGVSETVFIENALEEWDNLHNPINYITQKFTPGEIVTAYGGIRYSHTVAAKSYNGKDTGYYDENFAKIASDPILHNFYTFFGKFIKDTLGWLPEEEIDDLSSNFLPVIADRMAKEYGFSALKESVNGLGDWFLKSVSENNYSSTIARNPMSGQEIRNFKPRFINENVDIKDRSKDLILMAKLFSDMALVYKHKNTVKAEIDIMNNLLQKTEGSYRKDKRTGYYKKTDIDAKNIKELTDYNVRRGYYGIPDEDTLWRSDTKFYDFRELVSLGFWKSAKAKQAHALEKDVIAIRLEIEKGTLSEIELVDKKEELHQKEQEYYKLGGRSLSLTSILDSLTTQTRLTSLALAPISAIRNLLIGKINNQIHASGERDFTRKDLMWANRFILDNIAKYMSFGKLQTDNARLVMGLLSDTQLAEGEDSAYLVTMIDKHTTLDKFREMLPKAYTWLSSGDFHFKAETIISAMKHQQITTIDGKQISFIEAINSDREYNVEKYGVWNKEANGEIDFNDFYRKNMLKYKQLAFKLHGAVGGDVLIYAKKNAITRVLMLFKSWLPETVGNRFDPRHYDAQLERDEEGYYRTFGRFLLEKKLGIFKTIFQTIFKMKNGIEDELDLSNFKKAVTEFTYIIAIMSAYLLARSLAPDDDERRKLWNLLVLRQLNDLRRDMTFYSNINSVSQLTQNIFPVFRTLKNYEDALVGITYYTFGVKNKRGEEAMTEERMWLKISKVIPVASNINRVTYYMKDISEFGSNR